MTHYSLDWQILSEYVEADTTANSITLRLDREYFWDLRGQDDLVLRDRDTTGDGYLDERLYALQDGTFRNSR